MIAALTGVACAAAFDGRNAAQAQFFPGFGAPQQINTARGAIQLAPGWHVANSPVRTAAGYRVAVRSDTGEQRNMLIGANGALTISRPYEAAAPRAPQHIARQTRRWDAGKGRVSVAAVNPGPRAPTATISKRAPTVQPTAASSEPMKQAAPAASEAPQREPATQPSGRQTPGHAHGVPINPLD
jgi:hypothetical protein